jgi:hypothetical protein
LTACCCARIAGLRRPFSRAADRYALADDVALDLARSGRDRVLPSGEHPVEPARRVRHGRRGLVHQHGAYQGSPAASAIRTPSSEPLSFSRIPRVRRLTA